MWLGNVGFSYIGLIFFIMITVPNLIWLKNKPKNYEATNENKTLLWFEKIGQILTVCFVLIFSDFNINNISLWSIWLLIAILIMICYEIWWGRYFLSKKELKDFYSSFLGVPVAGATLPVTAFLILSIYGKNIWLITSVMILGIGHIGIHLQHLKEIKKNDI